MVSRVEMLYGSIQERDQEVLQNLEGIGWVKPIDIGGQDCSHHSSTLRRLVKKGLVERRRHGGWIRPSYQYRLPTTPETPER